MLSSLMLLFISILVSSYIFTTHSYNNKCICHQETLLLQLKQELIFNSNFSTKLVRWNESDACCKWPGVECDASGYVVSLQLDNEAISGGIGDSSSLFRFKYLQKLNLAHNHFHYTGQTIPKGIGNLTYLTHLNLSYAGFVGQVPFEISSLTRLASLDISNYLVEISLEHPNLEMLVQNLTKLRELYLDCVNITSFDERNKWSHIVSSYLPNLTALSLLHCNLYGPLSKSFWQLHSLSILRLDRNNLSAVVLHDLFTHFPSLSTLTLSECRLKGSIPSSFANLSKLIHVDLSFNSLTGSLPSTFFEGLSNLVHLNLYKNSFFGNIPQSLFALHSLLVLDLSYNQFNGTFQIDNFQSLPNLVHLDLSFNSIYGNIPQSLFALPSLLELDLRYNRFNGTFQLDNFQSLPNLTLLGLSGNSLSVFMIKSAYGGLQLKRLYLNSCNMSSFPDFIKHLDLKELDLSRNRIVGEIPNWIWGTQLEYLDLSFNLLTNLQKPYYIPSSLVTLYLQSNQLRGELHLPIPHKSELWSLSLANNSLSGSIPTSICNATQLIDLDLSGNILSGSIQTCLCNATILGSLHLFENKLSGSIPACLLINIREIDLSSNKINGSIPDIFPRYSRLYYLDVSNNALEGKIPKSIEHCKGLEYMNVGNNMMNDTFPCMLSSTLRVLVLHSNRFHGDLRCHTTWPFLQILDISSNHFSGSLESVNFSSWTAMMLPSDGNLGVVFYLTFDVALIIKGQMLDFHSILLDFSTIDLSSNSFYGEIPNAIGDLISLHQINFSHNALNGSIPKSFGQLKNLESLDLSVNQLTGPIPKELAGLTFLSKLNLSYNKFVGAIPKGQQIQTFSADSFEGNSGLCGFPLDINCGNTNVPPPGYDDETGEEKEIKWEYVCGAVGYVVGVGSIVWLLLFCRSFREKYFGKIEEVVEDMFIARDMRRRRARRAAAARN